MARHFETDAEAIDQLWSRLSDTRTGMLWLHDTDQHPQPMSHFVDRDSGALWFIASADSDLVKAVGHGGEAGFVYSSNKGDYHASLRGPLVVYESDEKLDEIWSIPASAWFEGGRDDPKVTLLKFSPSEAALWASDANPVLIGLKLANAAMRDGVAEPDVGTHTVVSLARAS